MQNWFRLLFLSCCALLCACSDPQPVPVELPEDVSAVTEGFINALRRGDTDAARKFVASSSQQYLDDDFSGEDAFKPAKGLKPLIHISEPELFDTRYVNQARVVYGAKQNEGWQTIELQLYWLDDEAIEIDDWHFSNNGPPPPEIAAQQLFLRYMPWFMIVMAILAAVTLAVVVWIAKRKPQIIAPDSNSAKRGAASTSSRSEN